MVFLFRPIENDGVSICAVVCWDVHEDMVATRGGGGGGGLSLLKAWWRRGELKVITIIDKIRLD